MKHKSQLKIQQMAFMMMAIFVFFVMAGMFYLVFYYQDLKKEVTLMEKNNAVELAGMLANSAEFSCGANCVDADRAMALRRKQEYQKLWNVAGIEIRTVYPVNTKEVLCTDSSYPDCNLIKIFEKNASKSGAQRFVALCKRVNEQNYIDYKCEMAQFIVYYETKQ